MRVLVVEDIPRHANRIAEGLRDQGIAVDVAYDGDEAMSKLHVNPYDVVLLDRDLPGVHGDQLCQIITHSEHPPMILMLTAAGAPPIASKGSRSAPTTTYPSPFISPSSSCVSARSTAADPPPAAPLSKRPASNSTDSRAPSPATDEPSSSPPKSAPCSKPC